MRFNYLLVLLITGAALVASWFLVPRDNEIAFMRLQSGDIDTSRALLEARIAKGDYSAAAIGPLSTIYLADADPDAAIKLVEGFVQRNPGSAAALDRLGSLLRQANRWQEYATNRMALYNLTGDLEALRDFGDLALLRGDGTARLTVLLELEKRKALEAEDSLELAQRRAAIGNLEQAEQGLAAAIESAKTPADDLLLVHHARYALARRDEGAIQRVGGFWLRRGPTAGDMQSYLSYLGSIGLRGIALALMRDAVPDKPEYMLAQAELERQFGDAPAALARLQRQAAKAPLDIPAGTLFFELALDLKQVDLAASSLRGLPPDLPRAMALLEAAQATGRRDIIEALRRDYAASLFADAPLASAKLALALGDTDNARRLLRPLLQRKELTLTERVEVGQQLLQMGEARDGLALLEAVADDPALPSETLADLGQAYLTLGRATEGAAIFGALRTKRPSPLVDGAWARLMAAKGETEPVRAWLGAADPRDAQLLEELYYLGNDAQSPALALLAAEKWAALNDTPKARLAQAAALLQANRPRDALSLIDRLPASLDAALLKLQIRLAAKDTIRLGEDILALLRQAPKIEARDSLLGMLLDERIGPPRENAALVTELKREAADNSLPKESRELRREVIAKLAPGEALADMRLKAQADPGATTDAYIDLLQQVNRREELLAYLPSAIQRAPKRDQAEARLHLLLDLAPPEKMPAFSLAALAQAADQWGGDWNSAYEEALLKLGRRDDLRQRVQRTALDTNVAADARREAAYRLLELGARPEAEAAFLALAANGASTSPDVQQLLYLWGPRPGPAALDWIETRARRARGPEQAAWLQILQERGGLTRLLALANADPNALLDSPRQLEDLISALTDANRRTEAANWLIRASQRAGTKLDTQYALLESAEAGNLQEAARDILRRMAALAPNDRELLRRQAGEAYAAGRRADALRLYAGYLKDGPGDIESYFNYGELLGSQNKKSEARKYYVRALILAERQRKPNRDLRRIEAWALLRLDRKSEALAAADRILADFPREPDLATDLASLALEAGDDKRAERFLNR